MPMTKKKKVALVSSHGGHLTEMLCLSDVFEGYETFHITYNATTPSMLRNCHFLSNKWFKNPLYFFPTLFTILKIMQKEKPEIIFSTGAEIAVPVFWIAKIFTNSRLIYMECSAQVTTPSMTGKALYNISDIFLVQWEPLLEKYGTKAKYCGSLI